MQGNLNKPYLKRIEYFWNICHKYSILRRQHGDKVGQAFVGAANLFFYFICSGTTCWIVAFQNPPAFYVHTCFLFAISVHAS